MDISARRPDLILTGDLHTLISLVMPCWTRFSWSRSTSGRTHTIRWEESGVEASDASAFADATIVYECGTFTYSSTRSMLWYNSQSCQRVKSRAKGSRIKSMRESSASELKSHVTDLRVRLSHESLKNSHKSSNFTRLQANCQCQKSLHS